MPITHAHLNTALDRTRRGDLGTFQDRSRSRYVIDPRTNEPWDLKVVVGQAMELAGMQVMWGSVRLTSDNLQRQLGKDLPDIELVSFQPRKHRRIRLGLGDLAADEVDWAEAKLESMVSATRNVVEVVRHLRSAVVRQEAERRAKGRCGDCGQPAPFFTPAGRPFLEVHHVLPLGRGGLDLIENVIALCPKCHRRRHHGVGGLDT